MDFTNYLTCFDYLERKNMKIGIEAMLDLLIRREAILLDIRFPEETAAWSFGFAQALPLNELPARLAELDKEKLIVTACPHNDRASLARHYLHLQGYRTKYLFEGLLQLANYLRGDKAREIVRKIGSPPSATMFP